MNLNKFFKVIVLVFGFAGVIFSGYSIYSVINKEKNYLAENPNKQIDSIIYQNKEYGFELNLTDSWKNYSIMIDSWEGRFLDGSEQQIQGPKIIIKNSKDTEVQCWQDLIVLIFNKQEWDMIEQENLSVSAAPIGPQKIGENQNYIFALPPRWVGFTDCLGQDEAQEIMKTFKIIDNFKNNSISLECFESEKYFFISNNENILIKYKQNSNQKITCEYFVQENDFQIEGLARFFLKFENDFLILDSGTSPSYRRLLVYDLIKKQKIYEDYYSKPIIIENNSISYWALSSKQATKENCLDFEKNYAMGLGTVIESYQMIDLINLEKQDLNQERCQITQ
jgi:hypothetical protein